MDILAQRSEQANILARSAPIINPFNYTIMARRRRNRRRGRRRSLRKYYISRGGIRL